MKAAARNTVIAVLTEREPHISAAAIDNAVAQLAKALQRFRREQSEAGSKKAHQALKQWLDHALKRATTLRSLIRQGPSTRDAKRLQNRGYPVTAARRRLSGELKEFTDWVRWARRRYSDTSPADRYRLDLELRVGMALKSAGIALTQADDGTFDAVLGVMLVEAGILDEPDDETVRNKRLQQVIDALAGEKRNTSTEVTPKL